MPELPEVETVTHALRRVLIDETIRVVIVRERRLRFPVDFDDDSFPYGKRIIDVRRRGRYVIVEFEGLTALVAHLGMSGSFRFVPEEEPYRKHEHVVFRLSGDQTLRYEDPRRFGFILLTRLSTPGVTPSELDHLGPEPLFSGFSGNYLAAELAGRSLPVKSALMDNRIVVGVGNIYANESLFAAKIHPMTPAGKLSRPRISRLVKAVKRVLAAAIEAGGTTISDFKTVDGSTGRFHVELKVYGREGEPCSNCGATVKRLVVAGRSTYFCARCQRR